MRRFPPLKLLAAGLLTACPLWAQDDVLEQLKPQTFYEQRLLDAVKEMNALDRSATEKEQEFGEIQRRFQSVATLFNGILASSPDGIEARLIYGKMLDRYGDRHGARDQFIEVLKRDPSIAVAHQQLGTYYAEEHDLTRALSYYLAAIQYAPDEPVYHFALGDLLTSFAADLISMDILAPEVLREKMFTAFGKAAELAPENPVFQFRYGEAFYLLEEPDWQAAFDHWNRFAELPGLDARQGQMITLHAARCLGEMEKYTEARAKLEGVKLEELKALRTALLTAINEAEAKS